MQSIVIDGVERILGNISTETDPNKLLFKGAAVYGDTPEGKMFTFEEIKKSIAARDKELGWLEDPGVQYIHDQGPVGQCNCDATASAIEDCRAMEGLPFVELSPADLYMRINRGGDNGSTLEDGIREAMVGIGTSASVPKIWKRGMRGAAPAERSKYRVTEVWLCPTFQHCASAAECNFRLITGILWYDNFRPDGDGWLPARGQGRPGGHAIKGYRAMLAKDGTLGIAHCNSWSTSYGVQGRMIIPQSLYGTSIGGWWAVRQTVQEKGDMPDLKT